MLTKLPLVIEAALELDLEPAFDAALLDKCDGTAGTTVACDSLSVPLSEGISAIGRTLLCMTTPTLHTYTPTANQIPTHALYTYTPTANQMQLTQARRMLIGRIAEVPSWLSN